MRLAAARNPGRVDTQLRASGLIERATQPLDECLAAVWTTADGLSEREAAMRLRMLGPNEPAGDRRGRLLNTPLAPALFIGTVLLAAAGLLLRDGHQAAASMLMVGALLEMLIGIAFSRMPGKAPLRLRRERERLVLVKRIPHSSPAPSTKAGGGEAIRHEWFGRLQNPVRAPAGPFTLIAPIAAADSGH